MLLMVVGDAVSSFFIHFWLIIRFLLDRYPSLLYYYTYKSIIASGGKAYSMLLFDFFVVVGFVVGELLLAYQGADFIEVHVVYLACGASGGAQGHLG